MENLEQYSKTVSSLAKEASYNVAAINGAKKNDVLHSLATHIKNEKTSILKANEIDIDNAKNNNSNLDESRIATIIDRLILDDKKIEAIISAVEKIATLNDSVGTYVSTFQRDDGLIIGKMRCPIGVIMMIYEARPNVTIDAFCLCFKSSNAVILRGGKEAINTNLAFAKCIKKSLKENNLDENICTVVEHTDRQLVE